MNAVINSGYGIVPATVEHAEILALNLTLIDIESLELTASTSALEAIKTSIACSVEAYAGVFNDEPYIVFGVAQPTMLSDIGVPWMISSSAIKNHGLEFVRQARAVVKVMAERYETLESYIDARYTNTIRMFKAIGFKVSPAAPYGDGGLLFHKLTLRS